METEKLEETVTAFSFTQPERANTIAQTNIGRNFASRERPSWMSKWIDGFPVFKSRLKGK
ncbi:MAG: hypothetical protein Tsb009_05840 [Planctomycetaceae bacterium]